MKIKQTNKLISEANQDEKSQRLVPQKTDQDPKEFEEDRSMNIHMKPQPYQTSAKKQHTEKKKK